jgi:hypothetical protein
MAENETVGGLGQYTQAQIEAFPEANRQAMRAVDESVSQGRAANAALMEFLNSQRGTGPSPLLQLATGLLRPTRAGSFGESLGAGVEGYTGALQQQRQAELNRAMQIQQLQAATANLGMQGAQQRMALLNQALQFPGTAAGALGGIADMGLLGAGGAGVPQTRTQLAVPGAAQGAMPSASPVGPQPQVTQTPLSPPAPAAPAAPAAAAQPEDVGNLPTDEFNQVFSEYVTSLPPSPARGPYAGPAPTAREGSVEETLQALRAQQAAEVARQAAEQAPAAAPPATRAPAAAPAPAAPAPAPARAAEPATRGAMSSDPLVSGAQRLLADAAANPSRYAGPQGRQLVERAHKIVNESPEGRAEVRRLEEQAKEDIEELNAPQAADRRFRNQSAEQQARTYGDLASSGAEARQLMDRLQMFDQVSADLRSGIPGWFEQQAARIGVGPRVTYIETANALLKQLIPAQRQGMPGAVSDFDARNFELSLPRLIGTPEGRTMISNTLKSVAEYNIARAQIASAALNGRITRQQAEDRLDELPSPFTRFNRMETERTERQRQQGGGLTPNADGSFTWSPGAP